MVYLVAPLPWLGGCPGENNRACHGSDRPALRDNEQTWAGLPRFKPRPKISDHGPAIMRNQDTPLLCGTFEEFGIADVF